MLDDQFLALEIFLIAYMCNNWSLKRQNVWVSKRASINAMFCGFSACAYRDLDPSKSPKIHVWRPKFRSYGRLCNFLYLMISKIVPVERRTGPCILFQKIAAVTNLRQQFILKIYRWMYTVRSLNKRLLSQNKLKNVESDNHGSFQNKKLSFLFDLVKVVQILFLRKIQSSSRSLWVHEEQWVTPPLIPCGELEFKIVTLSKWKLLLLLVSNFRSRFHRQKISSCF